MRQFINNNWKFNKNFDKRMLKENYDFNGFENVRIPHTVNLTSFNYFSDEDYQMLSVYVKDIFVDQQDEGKSFVLTFEGVAHKAKVYINGKFIGDNYCGYHAFSMEIKDDIKYNSNNKIVVVVDSRETLNQPPFGKVIDYMTYGGIYRDVYIDIRNLDYIKDVFVYTTDELSDVAKIHTKVCSTNENAKFVYEVYENNELILSSENNIELTNFTLWDLDNPHLYKLGVKMYVDEELTDCFETTFGIRKMEFTNEGFYLNGKKIKIRGLNRHQSYPYMGYAMVERGQRLDAKIIKNELGLNAVRCSHYPQSQYFIDECDKLGILVFIEIVGWQHIGDKQWQNIAISNVENMVKQYRNHPSIMIWGVRINESEDNHDLYVKTNEIAHELDPYRVTGGIRCIKNSELLEDLYTYNEFVHNGTNIGAEKKINITKEKKPYLITEYNGHMYPTKSFDPERIRCEHALRHATVLNSINKYDNILGGFGWCMFDYNTHKEFGSGDRICYHGVMDMFRNPKMAADVYKSQTEEPFLSISSNMNIGEYPGANRDDIYAFTNLDSVKLYKNDRFIKEFFPSDKYKYLNHPPILIDDLIGNSIEEGEGIDYDTAEKIKSLIINVVKYGVDKLPVKNKIDAVYLLLVKHYKQDYIASLFNKYVNNWGTIATSFTFEGIKNNEVVKTVIKESSLKKTLEVKLDTTELYDENSYDIATFRFRMLDENGNLLSFNSDIVQIDIKGPAEVIGPNCLALKGGMAGTYIKSTNKGEVVVTIRCNESILKYNINII